MVAGFVRVGLGSFRAHRGLWFHFGSLGIKRARIDVAGVIQVLLGSLCAR